MNDREPQHGAPLRVPIAAIAFDFDGTLADTRAVVVATVEQTLRELGSAPLAPDVVVAHMGLPLSQVFVTAGVPAAQLDAAIQLYRQLFDRNAGAIALFPGVLECLSELARGGMSLGITSSRGRRSLQMLLAQLNIAGMFEHVLGEEDAAVKKPAGDLVLELARRMPREPAEILVVGDTTFDVEMGHAAGAPTCAVTYGSHSAAQLRAASPSFMIDSAPQLLELLGWLRSMAAGAVPAP